MERQKRNIIKPTRYQTTSSDEDVRTRTVKKTYTAQKTSNIMSQDINELKHIFKNSSNIIENTASNTQYAYNTQAVQYLPSSQIPTITQQNQQSQQSQDMSAAFTIYNNDDESQNNDNESEKEEITSAARHAFQRNENNYNEITYTNLNEHFSPHLENRRLVEQDNIVNREVLYRIEEDMRRINNILNRFSNSLDRILKCVQKNQSRVLRKPDCLPISTEAEMIAFETINEETYEEVHGLLHAACTFIAAKVYVNYFQSVGGFTVKEAINLSFKEGIKDNATASFTWLGREENLQPLHNKRIIMAIYDAVCNNQYFNKPTKAEFQANMKEALRSAKQRYRMSIRKPNEREQRAPIFWNQAENRNPIQNEST